jgi:hypothetical protein
LRLGNLVTHYLFGFDFHYSRANSLSHKVDKSVISLCIRVALVANNLKHQLQLVFFWLILLVLLALGHNRLTYDLHLINAFEKVPSAKLRFKILEGTALDF